MQDCLNCLDVISTNCIRSEEEFSFEYSSFNDILSKLDKNSADLKALLSKNIDKKWIKEDHEYIIDYIQDIINKIDVIINTPVKSETKYNIPSDILGTGDKSLLQVLTTLVKEVDALKKKSNSNTSSLYTPNV